MKAVRPTLSEDESYQLVEKETGKTHGTEVGSGTRRTAPFSKQTNMDQHGYGTNAINLSCSTIYGCYFLRSHTPSHTPSFIFFAVRRAASVHLAVCCHRARPAKGLDIACLEQSTSSKRHGFLEHDSKL